MIINIASVVKKVLPSIKIIFGGPEVSYEFRYLFEENPGIVDVIVIGEGEKTVLEVISCFNDKIEELSEIDGIAFFNGNDVVVTKKRKPLELDEIPFVYDDF